MTKRMRETLQLAQSAPLRRLHDNQPGKPPWPAPATTLYALERCELLARARRRSRQGWWLDEWTITDRGREALKPKTPKLRPDRAVYMAHPSQNSGDYTYNRRYAIDDLEVMRDSLHNSWTTGAQSRSADARDRRRAAR